MSHFEVEVKSLLGKEQNADVLKEKMLELDPKSVCVSKNSQLNHYFEPAHASHAGGGGNIQKLFELTKDFFSDEVRKKFQQIVEKGSNFSVRTRQKAKGEASPDGTFRDNEVLLVIKASVDGGTSANTVARMEFEEKVGLSLEELDKLVQDAGYYYQAKWSRSREEYVCNNVNVCLDKNAGYGYLAEFEKIVDSESELKSARKEIDSLMEKLGVAELMQDRLARMFDFYNKNWADYYGTDKVFVIE